MIPEHVESGRSYLSKGFLKEAKALAEQNVQHLKNLVTADTPLIGVEPSAIITFRDEYVSLGDHRLRKEAEHIPQYSFMVDEFVALEIDREHIHPNQFTNETRHVKLHCHCYQKAFHLPAHSAKALSLPV